MSAGSALAYRGIPLQSAYCSTKGSLRAFFESVRAEREGAGVAVPVALPGAINTPQFERDRQRTRLQPQPVPPIYEPEPVVDLCERPIRELPVSWGARRSSSGARKPAPRRRPRASAQRLAGADDG